MSPVLPTGGLVQAPVLKWQYAGCYSSWCETGWYSSPAVADLDGNGSMEVIASAYSVVALNGVTGELLWRVASGHDRSEPPYPDTPNVGRTWPGIVVADVDGDDKPEIVTAHSGGWVSVYNENGYFEPGWPKHPTTSELRGLAVDDLDGDGTDEIMVSAGIGSETNTWVYEHTGALRPGWPQLKSNGSGGWAAGVYNDNAAAGDLDGDGQSEIVVPSDVHYICAYEPDASHIPAHAMYGGKTWGLVGVWEDPSIELRGWGDCSDLTARSERYRTNFAAGAAVLADVDGNGSPEVVATGNMYDCAPPSGYESRYNAVFVFNPDRSRFQTGAYDWRTIPVDTGAPLTENYGVIESNQPNPAVADLDGNGTLEIVFPSYDGRVHAFWLDKTEHG
ncbi:MAG: VCBS repeat-containing protein, partial [Thermoanaerobaculia bacterium]